MRHLAPDHDFGRSHRLLRSMGSGLGYDEYRALWADIGNRMDQEADRTGREFSMRDLGAEFLRTARAGERASCPAWRAETRQLPLYGELPAP